MYYISLQLYSSISGLNPDIELKKENDKTLITLTDNGRKKVLKFINDCELKGAAPITEIAISAFALLNGIKI